MGMETVEERHLRLQREGHPGAVTEAAYFDPKAEKIFLAAQAAGEPIIIFRAKDILSIMVLAHYQSLLETYIPENHEFHERVAEKMREVREWQLMNPAKTHLPD